MKTKIPVMADCESPVDKVTLPLVGFGHTVISLAVGSFIPAIAELDVEPVRGAPALFAQSALPDASYLAMNISASPAVTYG